MPPKGRRHVPSGAFATVIRMFMLSDKFRNLKQGTRENYARLLHLAETPDGLGAVSTDEMRPALVQAFLDGLSHKPGAQMNARTALRALEKWAIVRDLLPRPITLGTELVGSDGGHIPWTDEQVAFGEMVAVPHLSRVISLGANTGQRGSDIIRMRWTDIEAHDGHLGIKVKQLKTGREIWIPFTQAMIKKIDSWERRPGFIVLRQDGTPFMRRLQLSHQWIAELRRPQIAALRGLVLHGLRATAVVRLRRAGVSAPLISDMVGMSEPMVARYCRFSDQKDNALAAVHILDRTAIEHARKISSKITS
jgi:hypothetical protein